MTETVKPAKTVSGAISVPGDKSISHRYAMLTAIAEGESRILNYSTGADCQSTLACMAQLGIGHQFGEREGRRELIVAGRGIQGLSEASQPLDAGNWGQPSACYRAFSLLSPSRPKFSAMSRYHGGP